MSWFKKEDKPAYLNYKRGHIFEKERVEREHLLLENKEESPQTDSITDEILAAPPKKRIAIILGVIGLLLFGSIFFRLMGLYTTNLYGERDADTAPLTIDLSKVTAPDISVDVPDVDVPNVDLDVTLPDVKVDMDAPTQALKDQLADSGVIESSGNVYEFSASIHEDLVQSLENIKNTVVRYTNNQANKMTVSSRIEKEQATYAMMIRSIESRLSNGEYANIQQKDLLHTLQQQIETFTQETNEVKKASRTELVAATNTLIDNENERRNAFFSVLTEGLKADDIPYKSENGHLVF